MIQSRTYPAVYKRVIPDVPTPVGQAIVPPTVIPFGPPTPAPPTDPTSSTPDASAIDNLGYGTFGLSGATVLTFNTFHTLSGFDIENDTALLTVNFPNLTAIDPSNTQGGFLFITGCSSLTTITLPVFVPNNGNSYSFTACALSAATVNAILARFVANLAFVSGTLDLSGGTNSAPTGQGLTDKATLIGRGATITTN